MKIDLDAARAARREAAKEVPSVVIGGKEIALPVEMPYGVSEAMVGFDEKDIKKNPQAIKAVAENILRALLGDDYDTFLAARPSVEDLVALIGAIPEIYGVESLGESQASAAS